jgi:hypothetical protein
MHLEFSCINKLRIESGSHDDEWLVEGDDGLAAFCELRLHVPGAGLGLRTNGWRDGGWNYALSEALSSGGNGAIDGHHWKSRGRGREEGGNSGAGGEVRGDSAEIIILINYLKSQCPLISLIESDLALEVKCGINDEDFCHEFSVAEKKLRLRGKESNFRVKINSLAQDLPGTSDFIPSIFHQ